MSNIEDFIREHREDLDVQRVPNKLWGEIQEKISVKPNEPPTFQINFLRIAAAVSLLIVSVAIYRYLSPHNLLENQLDHQLAQINEQYAQQIASLKQNINQRREQVIDELQPYPSIRKKFSQDLSQLNVHYENLHQDLLTIDNQDILFKAMISNLQMQMQVLNQQLEILEEIQNANNYENDEQIF